MACMHGNKLNKLAEWNLLHDMINLLKLTKNLNSHYSPVLQGCINTQKGKQKFKKFRILLDSGCSSTILMGRLIQNRIPKIDNVIQWHMQAGNITTNLRVKRNFTLPELSATKIVTCSCHVDDSAKVKYYIILGRYLLTSLGLNLKLYDHGIEADGGHFKLSAAPMVVLGMYEFKDLNTG